MPATVCGPIDFVFLQDLSGSYTDDLPVLKLQIPNVIAAVEGTDPDADFAVASFIDKPTGAFGAATDYVYQTHLGISADNTAVISAVNALTNRSGADEPEAQLEGLLQTALRTTEMGYRTDSTRIVMLSTDSSYHLAGDFASQPANNLDTILDGTPPGTGEDYPTIDGLRTALLAANIFPVFSVTTAIAPVYEDLVAQLGFGAVVILTSDSTNFADAVRTAIAAACGTITHPGTSGNDTITGSDGDDGCYGGLGDDSIYGGAGNDTVDGGGDDDECHGGIGDDVLNGGTGNDDLYGEDDDDDISGGLGDDTMTGGAGADTFRLNVGDGIDVILDFEDGIDRLDLSSMDKAAAATAVATAEATPDGGTRIYFPDGSSVLLVGLNRADFDLSDVILDPANVAPIALDDSVTATGTDPLNIDVLANDTDVEGDAFSIVSVGTALHGTATLEADGTITYVADLGYVGPDSFIYVVDDGSGTASATVNITVDRDLTGTEGDDHLIGGSAAETFEAYGGNDLIESNGGADILYGGAGNDTLDGGAGADTAYGGTGADIFIKRLGQGNDTIADFEDGIDLIDLSSMDKVAAATAVLGATATAGGGTKITFSSGSITLDGMAPADMDLSDVILDAANAAPVAVLDTATTIGLHPVTIPVLSNDWDVEGDTLTLTGVGGSAQGSVVQNGDGTVTFTANPGFIGTASFTYTVSDGTASSTGQVRVTVDRDLTGGPGADYLIGDGTDELMQGFAGNDYIDARGGDDTAYGGADDDTMLGGIGNDTLFGDDGDDVIIGGPAYAVEDNEDDFIYGGAGDDSIDGGAKDDDIYGDAGNDTLVGSQGDDKIMGGDGDDLIYGGTDRDDLRGDAGNDTLHAGTGDDDMDGGDGDDTYVIGLGEGNDVIQEDADPATSQDRILFREGIALSDLTLTDDGKHLTIDIAGAGSVVIEGQLEEDVKQVEFLEFADGSTYNLLTGVYSPPPNAAPTPQDDTAGTTEDDAVLIAVLGNDTDPEGDTLTVTSVDTTASLGAVTINPDGTLSYDPNGGFEGLNNGETAVDTFTYTVSDGDLSSSAMVSVTITGVTDPIVAPAEGGIVYGTDADDIMLGLDAVDIMLGGIGNDTISGGAAGDALAGEDGDDSLSGGAGNDFLSGGAGRDALDGGDNDDYLGGDGDDDELAGGAGNDTLDGGAGADTMDGGTGDDKFYLDNAGDVLIEAAGGGYDRAYATASATLGDHVENGTLLGTADIDLGAGSTGAWLNGNSGNNRLTGGMASDRLDGNAGDDTISGGGGNDVLEGGIGADTFVVEPGAGIDLVLDFTVGEDLIDITALGAGFADLEIATHALGTAIAHSAGVLVLKDVAPADLSETDFVMAAGSGAPTISGTDGADTLFQGTGPLVLEGLGGNDRLRVLSGDATLIGGSGDDRYYVYDSATVITEDFDDGYEWVYTHVDFALADNVEALRALGSGDLELTGSADANWIQGNAGANTISGGAGNDRLTGKAGIDTFVFATGDGIDTITDFEVGVDRVRLAATGVAFGDLVIEQSGSAAMVTYGTDMICFTNTDANDLSEDHFAFS